MIFLFNQDQSRTRLFRILWLHAFCIDLFSFSLFLLFIVIVFIFLLQLNDSIPSKHLLFLSFSLSLYFVLFSLIVFEFSDLWIMSDRCTIWMFLLSGKMFINFVNVSQNLSARIRLIVYLLPQLNSRNNYQLSLSVNQYHWFRTWKWNTILSVEFMYSAFNPKYEY